MSDTSLRDIMESPFDESEPLRCKECGATITFESCRIEKSGASVHTFENCAGYVYTIGCFSRAHGGRKVGDYTFELSWFDGYAWCFLVCGACLTHLGWHYSGRSEEDFNGIILERLVGD